MGEIIMRNWDLSEVRVRVNWPSAIRQVRFPIRWVITPIRGLLNLIRQVVPLISHSRSYPPYRSHLHRPSLSFSSTTLPSSQEHKVKSSLSISPCHHHEFTLSAAYTGYSIHQVQRTRKIVCGPFILTISSWPLNVGSASGVPPFRSTATSQFSIRASKVKSPCHIRIVASLLPDELGPAAPSIDLLKVLVPTRSITASKCISKLARSRPPSVSPASIDHGLQVHLRVHSILDSQCISKLAWSWPPSASLSSLHLGLPVLLQTRSITASKFISKLTRSRPPSVSPDSLDYSLKVRTIMASTCISPTSLVHGHQVYLQIRSNTASKCISKVAWSRPRSISLSSLDRHFQAHLELLSSTAFSQSRYSMCRWVAI